MLTLATMKTHVSKRISKTSADYLTTIEGFINHRYDVVLRRYLWPQLIKTTTVTATAGVETMLLPKDVGLIMEMHDRTNDVALVPSSPDIGSRLHASIQDESGIPHSYWREEDSILAQPTSNSVLALVSGGAGDTTQKVRVWGISGGESVTEAKVLNGTTPVNTTSSYTRIDRISKDADTDGAITITSNSGAVTIATISPTEVSPRYPKVHLVKRPLSAYVYNLTYKVKADRLVNAEDIPLLPCHETLIIGAYADALAEQKQFQKAALEEAKFESLVSDLIAEFDSQRQNIHRFIPHVETASIDNPF